MKPYVVVVKQDEAHEDTTDILSGLSGKVFQASDDMSDYLDGCRLGTRGFELLEAYEYTESVNRGELSHVPHFIAICNCAGETYTLSACDEWRSTDSFRLLVATSNKDEIVKVTKEELIKNYTSDITDPESEWTTEKVEQLTFEDVWEQRVDFFHLEVSD